MDNLVLNIPVSHSVCLRVGWPIDEGAAVRRLLVLVRLRHATSDWPADRAADGRALAEPDVVDALVRADDCADLFGADRRADDVTFACPDARFRRAVLLLYLRHDSSDAVADGRAVAVTDAGAVGSAVGRRSGDKAARTDTYFPFKFIIESYLSPLHHRHSSGARRARAPRAPRASTA